MIHKKILVSILCVLLIIAVAPSCVFAETTTGESTVTGEILASTPNTTVDPTTVDPTATDPTDEAAVEDEAGVTPDSWLYSIEQMIENVQVAVTFSDEGKAELLVEFANERLAEAEIMSEENQLDLMEQVLRAYSDTIKKANFQVQQIIEDTEAAEGTETDGADNNAVNEEAVATSTEETTTDETATDETAAVDTEENTVISNLLASIELVQSDADKIVLKITGGLTEEQAEIMQNIIQAEVQNTIAIKAYVAAKEAYAEAVQEFTAAKAELGQARASGDEAAIAAALEKVGQAEQYKNDMQELRKDIQKIKVETNKETKEALKEQAKIMKEYKKTIREQAVSDQEDSLEAGDEQDPTVADDQNATADGQSTSDETTVDAQAVQNTVINTSSNNGHNDKGQGKR
ncbi:hemagglutinin [Dehalobacter sp. MCB1]|nr:hemagglutinin [Dehalobacter sp. MCB1]